MTLESSRKEESKFNPAPREDWSLVNQGAEARVWKLSGNDGNVQWICKERFSKAYRHPTLDERLTKRRCRSEARVLEKCTKKSECPARNTRDSTSYVTCRQKRRRSANVVDC